jgi:hypothetical protein
MDVSVTSSRMSEGRTMQDAYMDIGGSVKQEARAELLSRSKQDALAEDARAEDALAKDDKAEFFHAEAEHLSRCATILE